MKKATAIDGRRFSGLYTGMNGGGEPPVTSVDEVVSGSTGTDPACTSDCTPQLALGPPLMRGSFPRGSRTPVLAGTQA
ncbi:MAG: hypothetical protein ACOCY7_03605, partial [Halodesulfurarchaeum sp.]